MQPWSMNFARGDLGDALSGALAKWFALCRKWPRPLSLFFDARYGDSVLPVDLQFLKVVEAMETLAPARGIGKSVELRKKVKRLAEPYAEIVGIDDDGTEFARRVTATRNFYVHHTDRQQEFVSEGGDLLGLLWQCEAVLICHLTAVVFNDEAKAVGMLRDAEPIRKRRRDA